MTSIRCCKASNSLVLVSLSGPNSLGIREPSKKSNIFRPRLRLSAKPTLNHIIASCVRASGNS